MILYDDSDWVSLVFVRVGTVWPAIQGKFCAVSIYAVFAYAFSEVFKVNFGSEGRTILMASMSFLLIFRANQAYQRYWSGRTEVSEFFAAVREFILLAMGYVRGGVHTSMALFYGTSSPSLASIHEDKFDVTARELRVDLARLTVAICVTLRMHTNVACDGYCFGSISSQSKWLLDWDRLRLRQLLTAEEFAIVDTAIGVAEHEGDSVPGKKDVVRRLVAQFSNRVNEDDGPPDDWPDEFQVNFEEYPRPLNRVVHFIREIVFLHMNMMENNQPWGIKERFVTELIVVLSKIELAFENINQIINTPLPLPYANLCKVLLSIFLLSMPFFVDYRLGWFANTVIPAIVSIALLGIDAIATELENPFGDDANDLDIMEHIHAMELEAMEVLRLTGDIKGHDRFCWKPVPDFISGTSCRKLRYQLAVRDFADDIVVEGAEEPSPDTIEKWKRQFG